MTDTVHTSDSPVGGRVADATRANWVDRFFPAFARPMARLSRLDRPIGTWLLLLPCWWGLGLGMVARGGAVGAYDLWIFTGCAIGAVLMRGAGCTWNDITDRDFDARVARTRSRPIPSGQISVRGALVWMVAQALAAFGILLTLPLPAILLGIGSLALVCIYPFAKRFTWWPQVFLGLAFNWGALLAFAAATGTVGLAPVLLYLGGIAWTLFYDTIYAHQDREDDALIGVKSTARLFGTRTKAWLTGFLMAAVLLVAAAGMVAAAAAAVSPLPMLLVIAGATGFGWLLWGQLIRLDIDDPEGCLANFRSSNRAGLLLGLAFLAAGAV